MIPAYGGDDLAAYMQERSTTGQARKETLVLLKPTVKPVLALLGVIPFTDSQCVCYKSQGRSKPSLSVEGFSLGAHGAAAVKGEGAPAEEAAALHKMQFLFPGKLACRSKVVWLL